MAWFLLIGVACIVLAIFRPRLVVLVLGPAYFLTIAVFVVRYHAWFYTFVNSEGSAAGLVIPFLLWICLIIAIAVGSVIMAVGMGRMDLLQKLRQQTPSATPVMDMSRYEISIELEKARTARDASRVQLLEAEMRNRDRDA